MTNLTLTTAQINPLVGDIDNNTARIESLWHSADTHLIVFPELALSGYPPEDLLLRDGFRERIESAMQRLLKSSQATDTAAIIGHPAWSDGHCYNRISILHQGKVIAHYDKQCLPNYSVFDEQRYFTAGQHATVVTLHDCAIGLMICEDIWQPEPTDQLSQHALDLVICVNASPFAEGKTLQRDQVAQQAVTTLATPLLYLNAVGGQDELVFDGNSFLYQKDGKRHSIGAHCDETINTVTLSTDSRLLTATHDFTASPPSPQHTLYQVLTLGVKDYVNKNGFPGVIIGLSGGIDSALTLAIAVDALGPERVQVLMMPSRYTADMSNEDALTMAKHCQVQYHIAPIEPLFQSYLDTLSAVLPDAAPDTTEENIQARIRGNLLMALSNRTGSMVLTTGNKSELSVGYCTLYGDMAGGFAVLKDVPKTTVYDLARYRNQQQACIPNNIITRPPSAELRPDQTDQDSLPDYDTLDRIIDLYVNQDATRQTLYDTGIPQSTIDHIITLIKRNEYKRRQAPIGIRIGDRAFGKDRRYPITAGF